MSLGRVGFRLRGFAAGVLNASSTLGNAAAPAGRSSAGFVGVYRVGGMGQSAAPALRPRDDSEQCGDRHGKARNDGLALAWWAAAGCATGVGGGHEISY